MKIHLLSMHASVHNRTAEQSIHYMLRVVIYGIIRTGHYIPVHLERSRDADGLYDSVEVMTFSKFHYVVEQALVQNDCMRGASRYLFDV
jgi:hypothetical protein